MTQSPNAPRNQPKRTVSIIGTGSYLPERMLTNRRPRKARRDQRRMDHHAHRHQGTAHRRRGRAHQRPRRQGRASALENAGITAEEIDLIIVATVTPDMFFPEHRLFRAGEDRGEKRRLLRCERRLLRLPLRHRDRPAIHHLAHLRHHPRHRRGQADSASSTGPIAIPACSSATAPARPCCGIAAAGTASSAPSWRATAALSDILYIPGGGSRFPDHQGQRRRAAQLHQDERQGDLQARRHLHARRRATSRSPTPISTPRTSPASSRTRPISASSKPSPTG